MINKIFVLLISGFFVLEISGQDQQRIEPDFENEKFVCSKICIHKPGNGTKSVINPNPLLFDYDIKFYKLDIEGNDSTNQFSGSANTTAEVITSQMDTFLVEFSQKLSAGSVFINGIKPIYCKAKPFITKQCKQPNELLS